MFWRQRLFPLEKVSDIVESDNVVGKSIFVGWRISKTSLLFGQNYLSEKVKKIVFDNISIEIKI